MQAQRVTRILRDNILIVLVTYLFMIFPGLAGAQDPTIDIVKKMKEAFEPVKPSTRRVVLTVNSEGETVKFVSGQARKQFPDGKRMVVVLLQPTDLKGNNYLVLEPTDNSKPSSVWAWVPFARRLRNFAPVDAYEHYMGSDFTFADLGFVRLHPDYKLLGEETHGGKQTYKLEETVPKERAYYSRVVTWVDKATLLPVQRDYYDPAGTLWKTETFEITVTDGVPTPTRIEMKDLREKTSSVQEIDNVSYEVDLPDALFDPMKLSIAADSPVWQSLPAKAPAGQ
jgi:outer membrane lipoprotein-sorting protein